MGLCKLNKDESRQLQVMLTFSTGVGEEGINVSSSLNLALNIWIIEEDGGKGRLQSVIWILCECACQL